MKLLQFWGKKLSWHIIPAQEVKTTQVLDNFKVAMFIQIFAKYLDEIFSNH